MCRSVPQIDVRFTLMRTSLMPGDGTGTYRIQKVSKVKKIGEHAMLSVEAIRRPTHLATASS